jgi:hypothetical protein
MGTRLILGQSAKLNYMEMTFEAVYENGVLGHSKASRLPTCNTYS